MRQVIRALVAGGLGLAVALLAGCGSNSGLLSAGDANNLSTQIEQLSADVHAHRCSAVSDDLNSLATAVNNLPSTVSSTLNLDAGVQQARTSALQQCLSSTPSTTPTTTTTTTTTTTKTQTTPTTTTSSTPTQTTTVPPTTTATPPPNPGTSTTGPGSGGTGLGGAGGGPGGGPGAGGGNGQGNGNGGHGG